jgi:hypothetical protein
MLAIGDIWQSTTFDNNLIGFAAVLVASGVVWRYVVQPIRKGLQRVGSVIELVEHELKPNSGMTLRDAVDRIEANQHEFEQRLDAFDVSRDTNKRTRSTDQEVAE